MMLYLLYYSYDDGNSEDWNVLYTPVEVFSTAELRQVRRNMLAAADPHLEFFEDELVLDEHHADGGPS